jgi:hypothetical protein
LSLSSSLVGRAADARRAAVELPSAASPARSVPFYPRTHANHPHEPGTTTASTRCPPRARTQGPPRPEPCSRRAPPPARALPQRASAVPGNSGGKGPSF